jgi:DNA-binding transcriptional regulator/RsmH inhibitor MraZ
MYPSRLDDKGRMKMPAAFQQFLSALPEKKLFVTSLDRSIAQIYPMEVWRQNEKFFEAYRDHPKVAKKIAFNAADLGAEAEMEDQTVRLYAYKGRIEILTEAIYEERKREALETGPDDVTLLETAGFN